jgi:hypothetical protein
MNVKIKNLVENTESDKTELFNVLISNYKLKTGMQQHIQLLYRDCSQNHAANDADDFLELIIPCTIFVLQKHDIELDINYQVQKLANIFFKKGDRNRRMIDVYGNYIKLVDQYAAMDW